MTPDQFAALTADQQDAFQKQEANDILQQIEAGNDVTQAQSDFLTRILGKTTPTIQPDFTATITGTMASNLEAAGSAIGGFTWSAIWPLLIIGVLALVGLYLWKK